MTPKLYRYITDRMPFKSSQKNTVLHQHSLTTQYTNESVVSLFLSFRIVKFLLRQFLGSETSEVIYFFHDFFVIQLIENFNSRFDNLISLLPFVPAALPKIVIISNRLRSNVKIR